MTSKHVLMFSHVLRSNLNVSFILSIPFGLFAHCEHMHIYKFWCFPFFMLLDNLNSLSEYIVKRIQKNIHISNGIYMRIHIYTIGIKIFNCISLFDSTQNIVALNFKSTDSIHYGKISKSNSIAQIHIINKKTHIPNIHKICLHHIMWFISFCFSNSNILFARSHARFHSYCWSTLLNSCLFCLACKCLDYRYL